ncbi:RDD family protein [Streptomonospora salina]|uniref:Putative RDD family membrane protein YckC n=1 Tax=Streptomonospora salina TaxID=104205 RepID=A0A841E8D6_9ACTN|nr:RDD family protein [Streptomonospora salina]MBB5999395.1 putative RDD family membrane protein YckC [Streptomonospora salina]
MASSPYSWNSVPHGPHGPPAGPYGPHGPYGAPAHYGPAPQGGRQRPAASFGRRFTARVVDYTVISVVVVVAFVLISALAEVSTGRQDIADPYFEAWAFLFVFGAGPVVFLHDWLCNAAGGRTLGKATLGIRVVRADGGPLRQGQSAGRAAVFGLPQTLPCLGHLFTVIDCLAGLADSEHARSVHDRAGGTVVVRG